MPQQHVLVGQQYVVQGHQPTVLILKEKSISMGTDSDVTNQHGQVQNVPPLLVHAMFRRMSY